MPKPITDMTNAFSVKGYNVIVTGGNRGIGLGISTAFAQSGANVAILCRNKDSGDRAAESLSEYGGRYFAVQCDTSSMTASKKPSRRFIRFSRRSTSSKQRRRIHGDEVRRRQGPPVEPRY